MATNLTFKQYYLPQKKGFDSLVVREVPKVSPKFGQVLVRIKAVSLNWRDAIIAKGTYPSPDPMLLGITDEIGEGVTEWKVGDRVLANFTQGHLAGRLTKAGLLSQLGGEIQGLLGEYFMFPTLGVVRIPDYLSFEEASCLPCAALTAWNALYGLVPLRAGQTVLLQGTLTLQQSFDAIALHGLIHCIGHITNPDPLGKGKELRGPDAAFLALDRVCIVRGVVVGSREQLQEMLACFEAHAIRPVIDQVFEFEQARIAYEYLWNSSHTGKVNSRKEWFQARPNGLSNMPLQKCIENTFPECGACIRLNHECVREPKRQIAPDPRTHPGESNAAPSVRTVDTVHFFHDYHPFTIRETNRTSMRQYAMKYYINIMTQMLTVSQQYNSFLSEFVPMSIVSPALSGALISWASGHLAAAADERYRITALEARSTALGHLALALSTPSQDDNVCTHAATCLVLLTSEHYPLCHRHHHLRWRRFENIALARPYWRKCGSVV
ncbi:GroES-like protein [Aspergillus uvarum CBS 121591]|uniref:GroES-like protein n=1 Tax=Aspergillus uvarum CBS 121591 TaxID=1448315 RepID=A0A319C5P7_9EURO|nr:GroES-like protein [Aspergillus uvarum CBS 121591]PYH80484.1 GroES-like protein [Aspergillus uvarum CBS 121591]